LKPSPSLNELSHSMLNEVSIALACVSRESQTPRERHFALTDEGRC